MDKNNLNKYTSDILSKSLKIKNVDIISNTTSSLMPQKGGYLDATSSFMPEKERYLDATSSFISQKGGYLNNNKNEDINHLISMLSATSESNYTTNSTNTEEIKNKLLNILQDGGSLPELIETFELINEYVILLNIKSLENLTRPNYMQFENKIIYILNNLSKEDKKAFLKDHIENFIMTNPNILKEHPILLLIYKNIMFNIIDKSDLNEIINQITKGLYDQISKIIIYYLTTPPKTDDNIQQDSSETIPSMILKFYNMLTNIRDNIEKQLILYIQNSFREPSKIMIPKQAPAPASNLQSVQQLQNEINRVKALREKQLAIPLSSSSSSTIPLASSLRKM
jgi:hypothetical protein